MTSRQLASTRREPVLMLHTLLLGVVWTKRNLREFMLTIIKLFLNLTCSHSNIKNWAVTHMCRNYVFTYIYYSYSTNLITIKCECSKPKMKSFRAKIDKQYACLSFL